jgi:NifU-like protein involved in Fe-S cluster formation
MSFVLTAPSPEEFNSGGNFLNTPGKYHGAIIHAEENPTRNDKLVKGFMFEVAVQNQGECCGQTIKLYFGNGDPSHKDGGAFKTKCQVSALIAANVIAPSDLGKQVEINPESALNHQVCFEIALGKPQQDGKQWPELNYANIFHVDDPRAKAYPKDEEALSVIPKEFRRDEKFFAPLMAKPAPKKTQRVDDKDFDGL